MHVKVFGIGLSRTGNSSLTAAMEMLGYRCCINPSEEQWKDLDRFDFICEMPVQTRWIELEERYPQSKYVLTVRDVDEWVDAIMRWMDAGLRGLTPQSIAYRREQFGDGLRTRQQLAELYDAHREQVQTYFAGRPELLVMNVCSGDGWAKLVSFLQPPFPRTTKHRHGRHGNAD